MKCHQCNNNAVLQAGLGDQSIPLCLHCSAILQQTIEKNVQLFREEMNYSMDSIDSMFGISGGPRYPTKRPVLVSGGTVNNNHISINNSQVGVLNTGNINNLNQIIDSLYSVSQKELADNVKKFSEAVLKENDLTDIQKTQVLESLDIITKELFQKPENKKKTLVDVLFGQISAIVEFTANSLAIWHVLHPLLKTYF